MEWLDPLLLWLFKAALVVLVLAFPRFSVGALVSGWLMLHHPLAPGLVLWAPTLVGLVWELAVWSRRSTAGAVR